MQARFPALVQSPKHPWLPKLPHPGTL